MGLRGQGDEPRSNEKGYAMAALLVSLAVMSVLMSVAMPVWRHEAQREKEAELVFRGEQYARAIALYRSKNANNFPPSIDVLVQGKYLRKKYEDPMTEDGEFRIIPLGGQAGQIGTGQPGQPGQPGPGQDAQGQRGAGARGAPPQVPGGRGIQPRPLPEGRGGFVGGGIIGVASKSTDASIRIYKGQTRYDQWPFTFNVANRPGGQGADAPGMPGGRGQAQPGQPGLGGRGGREGGRGPGRGTGSTRPGDTRGGIQPIGPGGRGLGRPPGG
jgi:type II secretory pathway pseudopilin PulG